MSENRSFFIEKPRHFTPSAKKCQLLHFFAQKNVDFSIFLHYNVIMQRFIEKNLIKWKESIDRKPLIINGARQVGKTWLMKEFGKKYYKNFCYVNFDKDKQIKNLFKENLDLKRIILGLNREYNININKDETLIIFDEIQECKEALASLKYFNEEANEYHIMSAGSYMGIALHEGTSFPVGKVDTLYLYPMTFNEYLVAIGNGKLYEMLMQNDVKMIDAFSNRLIGLLKDYLYIGGMPEVVEDFSNNFNYVTAREKQHKIIDSYKQDISKHCILTQLPKVDMVFESIPMQLAKDNKKFIYNLLKKGARANDFEYAICYLSDVKMINKIYRVATPKIPLKYYNDINSFKIYMLDIGLMNAMSDLNSDILNKENDMFVEYKGALAEQYVSQMITSTMDSSLHYFFSDEGRTEIDFMMEGKDGVIPIEVKSGRNVASKSLKYYVQKFKPKKAIRISLQKYEENGIYVNIPLYNIDLLKKFV